MSDVTTPPRARRWPVVLLAAVLALAAGFALAQFWPGKPGDDSAEAGFARDMSSHHAQAVEIAMLAYDRATTPDLKNLGYDIALTQEAQIGTMSAWLVEWDLLPTGSRPRMAWMPDGSGLLVNGLMPGMATPTELADLRAATGPAFDILVCQLMLRHHLGGIHMVDGILKATDDPEVTRLATAMKAGQQKEIVTLREILTALGAKPL
ncbi:DUF305 domain-containing protein [Longispora sp. K20-0274]|uniref:DUF305 domain-containing protein n=1 Tax=Longispora sp. K20-0274 TaxID=3088255 RepID=UPI003999F1FC